MTRNPNGATHSFRLSPRAAQIMDTHPAIVPNSKLANKSAWASKSIQWFFDSPMLRKERDPDTGDFTGKFVVGNVGQPRPIDLFLRIEELEKELAELARTCEIADDEADQVPQVGVLRVILHRIRSFHL